MVVIISCIELNWADIKYILKKSLIFEYENVICENI